MREQSKFGDQDQVSQNDWNPFDIKLRIFNFKLRIEKQTVLTIPNLNKFLFFFHTTHQNISVCNAENLHYVFLTATAEGWL